MNVIGLFVIGKGLVIKLMDVVLALLVKVFIYFAVDHKVLYQVDLP